MAHDEWNIGWSIGECAEQAEITLTDAEIDSIKETLKNDCYNSLVTIDKINNAIDNFVENREEE